MCKVGQATSITAARYQRTVFLGFRSRVRNPEGAESGIVEYASRPYPTNVSDAWAILAPVVAEHARPARAHGIRSYWHADFFRDQSDEANNAGLRSPVIALVLEIRRLEDS